MDLEANMLLRLFASCIVLSVDNDKTFCTFVGGQFFTCNFGSLINCICEQGKDLSGQKT